MGFASGRCLPLTCRIRCVTFGAIFPGGFGRPRVDGGGGGGGGGEWKNIAVVPGISK